MQSLVAPVLLREEVIVIRYRGGCRGVERVVREKHVRYAFVLDVVNDVVRKVAHIHNVNIVERTEQVPGQRVAVAVLKDKQAAPCARVGFNVHYF